MPRQRQAGPASGGSFQGRRSLPRIIGTSYAALNSRQLPPKPKQGAPRGTLFYSNPSKNYALAGTGTTAGTGVSVTT